MTLNEKLETLNRVDSEILELTAEEGIEGEIQQSDECKEKIYEGLTRINRVLDTTTTPTPVTLYGAMLSSVLLTKLPPDLRLIVSRKVSSDDEVTMENLLRLFEEELVARERAFNPYTSHSQGRRSQERGRHSALLSGACESGTNTGFSCCYCQQQHAAKDWL